MKFIPEKHNVRWWISRSSLNRPNPSPLGGQDITHNHARGSSTTKPTGRNLRHEMPTESQNERWRFSDFTSPNDHTRSTRVDTFPRHFLHSIYCYARRNNKPTSLFPGEERDRTRESHWVWLGRRLDRSPSREHFTSERCEQHRDGIGTRG
jgi:hypothetical protein